MNYTPTHIPKWALRLLVLIVLLSVASFIWLQTMLSPGYSFSPTKVVDGSETYGRMYLDASIDSKQNIHLIWMSVQVVDDYAYAGLKTSPVYYQRGDNLGQTWSVPYAIPTSDEFPLNSIRQYPRIIAIGDTMDVFWTNNGLNCKISTNNGKSWAFEKHSLPDVVGSDYSIITKDDTLYIVYVNNDGTFFSKSGDLGVSWITPVLIGPTMGNSMLGYSVSLTISKGTVHVVGEASGQLPTNGVYSPRIYYIQGLNMGSLWEKPREIDLTNNRAAEELFVPAIGPKIIERGNDLLIFYQENGIFYLTSHDNGNEWFPPTASHKATSAARYGVCKRWDGNIMIFWIDSRNIRFRPWAFIPFAPIIAFDSDPTYNNNDLFFENIDGTSGITGRLTPQMSYAEDLYDAIFCGSTDSATVVIWGGKKNIGNDAYDDSKPSEIFIKVFKKKK